MNFCICFSFVKKNRVHNGGETWSRTFSEANITYDPFAFRKVSKILTEFFDGEAVEKEINIKKRQRVSASVGFCLSALILSLAGPSSLIMLNESNHDDSDSETF